MTNAFAIVGFNLWLFTSFQIFDATTNSWRVVDEKTRTDVLEKIVEGPTSSTTVYVDDIIDVRNVKNVTNINENVTNLTDVTNIKNIRNINNETVERIDEVITDINKITRDTVDKTSSLVDRRDDTVIYDRIDITKTKITDDTSIKKVRTVVIDKCNLDSY